MRKFISYFNLFDLDLNGRSYKSPMIRIGASVLVMLIVCLARLNVTITDPAVSFIVTVLILAVMILSILCLFIAAVECLQVGDNRKKDKARAEEAERFKK